MGVSGFGLELTLRVPRHEPRPPSWALEVLRVCCGYVYDTGIPLADGEYFVLPAPLAAAGARPWPGAALRTDPQLRAVATRCGRLRFVQLA